MSQFNSAIPPPSIEEANIALKLIEKHEQLWKLQKINNVLYHLCYECQNRLFHSSDKVVRNGDKVIIKIELCNNCVNDNCCATDLLFKKKRTQEPNIALKQVANPEQLWKLLKGKTVLQYFFCNECQQQLFNSSDTVVRYEDKVVIKIELCNNCVKENCCATDLLSNKKKIFEKKI